MFCFNAWPPTFRPSLISSSKLFLCGLCTTTLSINFTFYSWLWCVPKTSFQNGLGVYIHIGCLGSPWCYLVTTEWRKNAIASKFFFPFRDFSGCPARLSFFRPDLLNIFEILCHTLSLRLPAQSLLWCQHVVPQYSYISFNSTTPPGCQHQQSSAALSSNGCQVKPMPLCSQEERERERLIDLEREKEENKNYHHKASWNMHWASKQKQKTFAKNVQKKKIYPKLYSGGKYIRPILSLEKKENLWESAGWDMRSNFRRKTR